MSKFLSKGKISLLVILSVILIDQVLKVCVKMNMFYNESIYIADWFKIYFTENNGMAFGMEIFGKLFLTSFRIVAVSVILYYLFKIINKGYKTGYIVCISLIFAGAVGNIIDSMFYGVFFSESTFTSLATFLPEGGGYAPLMYGKVVDMFYFPIIETTWPEWVPLYGGSKFIFFSPVFNFADSAISCGVIALLLFYRKYIGSISK